MFEVPGSNIVAVTVDKDAVLGLSPPQYTYSAGEVQHDHNEQKTKQHKTPSKEKKAL